MDTGRNLRSSTGAASVLRAAATVLVIALAPLSGTADAPTTVDAPSGTVQVRAEGSAEAVPDIAVLGLSVDIIGSSVGATKDRAAQLTQAVIDELERHGVAEKDIRTNRFSIDADYRYTNDGRRRLNGYRVVHSMAVTYRDLDTVGVVIDAVSRAGGNALAFEYVALTHADPERHEEAARRDAVDRLHRTARQLAEASNRELGPLLEIGEDVSAPDYGPYRTHSAGDAMLRSEAADTPISIGSDVISVTVRGVFALR